jgi:hypothetical protein
VAKLMVWWDDEADEGTLVQSPEELVELLTRVNAEAGYPVLAELLDADDPHSGSILDVGLHGDRGALYFSGPGSEDGVYSFNGDAESASGDTVAFDYMRNRHDIPVTALHPLDEVLRASVEFMELAGQRPSCLEWQPRSSATS